MTFGQAYTLAFVIVTMHGIYEAELTIAPKFALGMLLYLAGHFLWKLHGGSIADDVRKGLEDFARDYRR